MPIPKDTMNGKQLLDLMTSSVVDEEVLDQYAVYVDAYESITPVKSISIESMDDVASGKPVVRRIIIKL